MKDNYGLLAKEDVGNSEKDNELLTALIEKMLSDEAKRKAILEQIRKLQKKKKR